jgi:hypothetical protein
LENNFRAHWNMESARTFKPREVTAIVELDRALPPASDSETGFQTFETRPEQRRRHDLHGPVGLSVGQELRAQARRQARRAHRRSRVTIGLEPNRSLQMNIATALRTEKSKPDLPTKKR